MKYRSLLLAPLFFITLVPLAAIAAKETRSETSLEAEFKGDNDEIEVTFSFTNGTPKEMFVTDDPADELVHTVRFAPADTCVLVSKLMRNKEAPPTVTASKVAPGKTYKGKLVYKLPLKHQGDLPKGWSASDKPQCHNLKFELGTMNAYPDLEASPEGKKFKLNGANAQRHTITMDAQADGFDIPIQLGPGE